MRFQLYAQGVCPYISGKAFLMQIRYLSRRGERNTKVFINRYKCRINAGGSGAALMSGRLQCRRDSCIAKNASTIENIQLALEDDLRPNNPADPMKVRVVSDLLMNMLASDPAVRYSVQQALSHPAMDLISRVL